MPEKITKRLVDATKPSDRDVFVWDTEVRGFGLKVTPGGGKVYVLQYRMEGRGSVTRRFTIGKHGSPWTPDLARDEALKLLAQVRSGTDPQSEKAEAREKTSAEEDQAFSKVANLFIERYAQPRTRSWPETKRLLDKHAVPKWGSRSVREITRRDVSDLLESIVDGDTPILANRVLAAVRKLFNWAVEKDLVSTSPCVGIRPPAPEVDRDRVLSDPELAEVWRAAGAIGYPFGPLTKLLILTAQRRDEVAGMRWSELHIDTATWTIPASRAKNGKAHEVPLSKQVLEIIDAIPRQSTEEGKPAEFVFTTTGTTRVSGFSRAKASLDKAIREDHRKAAATRQELPGAVSSVEGWRLHDLRRTATTGMASLGFAAQVVDRILNHVQNGKSKGVATVYNRYEYLPERRAALDAWAGHVDRIVKGT